MPRRPPNPILVDLEQFASLDEALQKVQLNRPFDELAMQILSTYNDRGGRLTLLSFFFMSAVTRARGLREGVVREIEAACPPSAMTLLRQLAETVATVFYVADHPAYAEAIAFRPDELRVGAPKRKNVQALIHHMDRNYTDQFELVYNELNDMTHFNSTAMWSSHQHTGGGHVRWSSTVGWKEERDPLILCALTLELTGAMTTALIHLGETLVRTIDRSKESERWVVRPLG